MVAVTRVRCLAKYRCGPRYKAVCLLSEGKLERHTSCGTISVEAGLYEIGEISSCGSATVYTQGRRSEN
jgi:hypothetical protein